MSRPVPGAGPIAVALAATAAYRLADRLRRWGTRGDEAAAALPGEDLVPGPAVALTQAITIAAPPVAVWPWIAQLGADRGGFYSYAWIENLGGAQVVNADRIVPSWQHPVPGEQLRLRPRVRSPGWRPWAVQSCRSGCCGASATAPSRSTDLAPSASAPR